MLASDVAGRDRCLQKLHPGASSRLADKRDRMIRQVDSRRSIVLHLDVERCRHDTCLLKAEAS